MNTIIVYTDKVNDKLNNAFIEKFIYNSFTIVITKNENTDDAMIFDIATNQGNPNDCSSVDSVNLSEEVSEENNEPEYTKTDIHRMSVDKLRSLAAEQGIDGVEEMNGADIKKLLLEKIES